MKSIFTGFLILAVVIVGMSCGKKADSTLSVQSFIGDVKVVSPKGDHAPAPGETLAENDAVTTGPSSLVDIMYGSSGIIRINENSSVTLSKLFSGEKNGETRINMDRGKMFVSLSKLSRDSSFEIKTTTSVAAVRGTAFRVLADSTSSQIDVITGKIAVSPVKDGQVVPDIQTEVESSKSVVVDQKAVEEAVEKQAAPEAVAITSTAMKEIHEEVKNIAPAKDLNQSTQKEITDVLAKISVEKDRTDGKELETATPVVHAKVRHKQAEALTIQQKAAKEQEVQQKKTEETKERRVKNIPTL